MSRRRFAISADRRPDPDALLREVSGARHHHGSFRIYLGYAHGCGTTSAMLDEGRRRAARGTDVVVAGLEPRPGTLAQPSLAPLEVLPGTPGVLDVGALLARNPDVALVGSLVLGDTEGRPRHEAVHRLQDAGITVIATAHVAEVESTRGLFAQHVALGDDLPSLPDEVLFSADEIEMVDVTPEMLIARLREGKILPADQVADALQKEFRRPVLQALREATFRVVAEHAERHVLRYLDERGIKTPWESRSRILVCTAPRPGAEDLIRQAAQRAAVMDGSLVVLTVRNRPRSEQDKQRLGRYATLVHELGGEYVTLYGRNPAELVVEFARARHATEVILGRGPARPAWQVWRRTFTSDVIRRLKDVDVHILRTRAS